MERATHERIAGLEEALRVSHACEKRLRDYAQELEAELKALHAKYAHLWQAYQASMTYQASLENHDG